MKKHILSFFIFVLLLSLIAVPAASAESWNSLGTWSIGQNVSFQLTAYAFDDSSNSISIGGQIPPGCSVDRSYAPDTAYYGLILNGVPTTAGSYDFQIIIDGEIFNFNLTVAPEEPDIAVIAAPTSCAVGSTTELTVASYVSDGGSLSYQWYRNGEAVFGGTNSSISIATTSPGTYSFYCEVTNTINGASATAVSDIINVDIQYAITGISVSSWPSKTTYKVGENLDTSGLAIRAIYEDGSTKDISSGFTVSPTQFTADDLGQKTIVVTYGDQVCSYQVNVESNNRTLSVVTMPNKTAYDTGDTLDTTGLQLCLTNGNEKKYIQNDFNYSPITLSTPGTQVITVSYDGLFCTFNVSVKARQTDQLKVKTLPVKTAYLVGESLNTEGLIIEKVSGTGNVASTQTITAGFSAEPAVLTKAGQQTVTVSYENLTTTFTVNVSETATTAPTEILPTQDAAAQAATAAANAAINARNQQSSRTGLIIFIAIVAVLALLVLGVYIYLAKADNIEDTVIGKLIQRLTDKMNK